MKLLRKLKKLCFRVKQKINNANDAREYSLKINKNRIVTIIDMLICYALYGAPPKEYYYFEFFNKTHAERKTFFTARDASKLRTKNFKAEDSKFYFGKWSFVRKFSDFLGRKSFLSKELTFEQFMQAAVNGKVICKPVGGEQGKGILVFEVDEQNKHNVFDEIKKLDSYIVEEWIIQHHQLNAVYPDAINPIRIQTLVKDNKAEIAGATLTVGNGKKFANASAEALFALVDIKNGGGVYRCLRLCDEYI